MNKKIKYISYGFAVVVIFCALSIFGGKVTEVNASDPIKPSGSDFSWPDPDFKLTHFDSDSSVNATGPDRGASMSRHIIQRWNWMQDGMMDTADSFYKDDYFSNAGERYDYHIDDCSDTYTFSGAIFPGSGIHTSVCNGSTTVSVVDFPMSKGRDSAIGRDTFTEAYDKYSRTYSTRKSGITSIILHGNSDYYYSIPIFVGVAKMSLVDAYGTFGNLVPVGCAGINIMGTIPQKVGDGPYDCWLRVVGRGNSTINVTPSVSAKYYIYQIGPDSGTGMTATTTSPSAADQAVASQPNMSYLSPDSTTAGSAVAVSGWNYATTNNSVQLTNTTTHTSSNITGLASSDGYSLTFTVPVSTLPGSYDVKVKTPTTTWSNSVPLTITSGVPTIPPITPPTTPTSPTITFTATPNPVALGQSTTVSWSTTNAITCASNPRFKNSPPVWNNPSISGSFTLPSSNITATGKPSITLNLTCTGTGGSTANSSLTIQAVSAPSIATRATVTGIRNFSNVTVPSGTPVESLGLPNVATVILSDSTIHIYSMVWDNGRGGNNQTYDGYIPDMYTFTGTITLPPLITNPNNLKAHITVIVAAPFTPPVIPPVTTPSITSFTAIPSTFDYLVYNDVIRPQDIGLQWSAQNVTSCSINGSTSGTSGPFGSTGSTVKPAYGTTIFTLTCTDALGHSVSKSVLVTGHERSSLYTPPPSGGDTYTGGSGFTGSPSPTPTPDPTSYPSSSPSPSSTPSPTTDPVIQTKREAVRQLYLTLMQREPDQQGWDYWTNSSYSIDQIRTMMMNTAEYRNRINAIQNPTPAPTPTPTSYPSSSPSSSPEAISNGGNMSISAAIWNAIRQYFGLLKI